MKFYIISIILNIMILLIPAMKPGVLHKLTEEKKIITVNLEESTFEIPKEIPGKNSSEKNQDTDIRKENESEKAEKQLQKPFLMTKETEKKDIEIKHKSEINSQKILKEKVEKKPENKSENNSDKGTLSAEKVVKTASDSKKGTVSPSGEGITGKTVSSGGNIAKSSGSSNMTGNIRKETSGGGIKGNGNKSSASSSENVCREGKDFTVSYNPNLKYPISMQRSGRSETVVVQVRLNFNRNGSVSVISASGGNSVFQSEAKKTAARIRVNIKNPETLKCTITKPFRFTLG